MNDLFVILSDLISTIRYHLRLYLFRFLESMTDNGVHILCNRIMRKNKEEILEIFSVLEKHSFSPPDIGGDIVVSYIDEYMTIRVKNGLSRTVCKIAVNLNSSEDMHKMSYEVVRDLGGEISHIDMDSNKSTGCEILEFDELLTKSMEKLNG